MIHASEHRKYDDLMNNVYAQTEVMDWFFLETNCMNSKNC